MEANQRGAPRPESMKEGMDWMSRLGSYSPPKSPEERSPRTVRATKSMSTRSTLDWLSRLTSSPEQLKSPKQQERRGLASRCRAEIRRSPLAYLVLFLSVFLNVKWLSDSRHPKLCLVEAVERQVEALQTLADSDKGPLRIGGRECSTRDLEALRSHLSNVVLVINVNYDFVAWNTSTFLREVYGRFFLDVVFIGPNTIPDIGVEARAHTPWRHRWCYAYYYFPTIVARYPNADGYLWMNDDVVLNYWTLINTDLDKLWLPDTPTCWKDEKEGCRRGGPIPKPEVCRCQGVVPFADKENADILDGWSASMWHRKLVRKAWLSLDSTYRQQHFKSVNSSKEYHKRVVDIWYVPRRLAMTMAFKLMPSFVEAAVWSEVAVPMMFHAMEDRENFDPIFSKMVYRWERRPDYSPLQYWNESMSAFHHWKLASTSGKLMLLNAFKSQDECLEVLVKQLEVNGTAPAQSDAVSQSVVAAARS